MKAKELKSLNAGELQAICQLLELDFNEEQTEKELIETIKTSDKLEFVQLMGEDWAVVNPEQEPEVKLVEETKCPFEELQQDGFALIAKIKTLSNERRKLNKPTARLDASVSQLERLIKNNFIK